MLRRNSLLGADGIARIWARGKVGGVVAPEGDAETTVASGGVGEVPPAAGEDGA